VTDMARSMLPGLQQVQRDAFEEYGDGVLEEEHTDVPQVWLRARWVTRRARWVTLRARWVTMRARWVTLRARWVTLRARWVTLRARWVTLRARWVTPAGGAHQADIGGDGGAAVVLGSGSPV
jgi:hypothetical protein